MSVPDTIAAIATAPGEGGIAIIRLSGPASRRVLGECFRPLRAGKDFVSHRLYYGRVVDGEETLDEAMAVFMAAPRTYTREDVAEIHCHGGRVSAARVLQRVLALGARPAEPGEFTKRAFLNGRIDLSRAEAVMQIVGAGSEAAARASVRQLEGGVSAFVEDASRRLTDLLALIEASTDFPEEVEEETAAARVAERARVLAGEIARRADGRSARVLREGAAIVLSGRPNVGKSSLMNALLSRDRAIVTEEAGTTRDVLTERISLGGVAAELSDTAGLRDARNAVEKIGVERAVRAAEGADLVLLVLDGSAPFDAEDARALEAADARTILCLNKSDKGLTAQAEELLREGNRPAFALSALTGAGVPALEAHLSERARALAGDGDG